MAAALGSTLSGLNWQILLAGCLFYTAGMWLNDVAGAAQDAVYHPERPIPQGKIGRKALAGCAVAALLAAVALLPADKLPVALALAVCIVTYNLLAARSWLAGCFFIAACRALLLLLVADWQQQVALAGLSAKFYHVILIVYGYIFLLSALAKNDHLSPQRKKTVGVLLGCISLLDALLCLLAAHYAAALLCLGLFVLGKRLKVRS